MSVSERGFSLLEVLIAMVISSILLLSAARFLPALQREILQNTRQLVLEDELWQRIYTVAKHLQRAGYCRGNCIGEGLMISAAGDCVIGTIFRQRRPMPLGFVFKIRCWKPCVAQQPAWEKVGIK